MTSHVVAAAKPLPQPLVPAGYKRIFSESYILKMTLVQECFSENAQTPYQENRSKINCETAIWRSQIDMKSLRSMNKKRLLITLSRFFSFEYPSLGINTFS